MSHARGTTHTFAIMYLFPLTSEAYFWLTFLKTLTIMPLNVFLVVRQR